MSQDQRWSWRRFLSWPVVSTVIVAALVIYFWKVGPERADMTASVIGAVAAVVALLFSLRPQTLHGTDGDTTDPSRVRQAIIWSAVAVVIVSVAVIISPWTEDPELEVVLGFGEAKEIEAVRTDPTGTFPTEPTKIKTSPVDIMVKNTGDDAVIILASRVNVLFAGRLKGCESTGGEMEVTGEYDVVLPRDAPEVPFPAQTPKMTFEVPAHGADRMNFTFGPDAFDGSSGAALLYAVRITLVTDTGQQIVAGTAALTPELGSAEANFRRAITTSEYDCFARNREMVARLGAIPATRLPEVSRMIESYGALMKPMPSNATPSCAPGPDEGSAVTRACVTFDEQGITTAVTLRNTPVDGSVSIRLQVLPPPSSGDSVRQMQCVVRLAGERMFTPSLEVDTGTGELTQAGCDEYHADSKVVSARAHVPIFFQHRSIETVIELWNDDESANGDVIQRIPATGTLHVVRGS